MIEEQEGGCLVDKRIEGRALVEARPGLRLVQNSNALGRVCMGRTDLGKRGNPDLDPVLNPQRHRTLTNPRLSSRVQFFFCLLGSRKQGVIEMLLDIPPAAHRRSEDSASIQQELQMVCERERQKEKREFRQLGRA